MIISSSMRGQSYSELESVMVDQLRLSVEVLRTYTTILSDGTMPDHPISSSHVTINAYLRNESDHKMIVLLGKEGRLLLDVGVVCFASNYWHGYPDAHIKPRLDDYRPIELSPGEIAALPCFQFDEKLRLSKIKVCYNIDKSFAEYYKDAWVGDIVFYVSVPQ